MTRIDHGILRTIAGILLLLMVASAPATAATAGRLQEAADQLASLVEEVLEFRRRDERLPVPEDIDPRYEARLERVSVEAFDQERGALEGFLERLASIDRSRLAHAASLDASVLELQLRDRIAEIRHRGYLLPLGSRSGFHFSFAGQPDGRFETVEQYDRYIARMQSFHEHVRQQIALLRAGIEAGWVMPAAVMDGYGETAGAHVAPSAEESAFAAPLRALPEHFPPDDRERILRDGMKAIERSVLPGYRALHAFFRDEYVPASRATLGVTEMPGGDAFYAHRVHRYTTLDVTPREVHEIGLAEVDRIRAEMDAIRAEVGFGGDHAAFVEHLRTDPRFTVPTEEEYLALVALAAKRMDGHLPRLFRGLPRTPYGIRAMPAHIAPRQSAGYYDRGDPDGDAGGWVNINTSLLDSRPTWVASALAFHEGVPGHHLQIMLAAENEEISSLRRNSGVTAFVEGWGLYAERLGLDVGLYDDPYQRFGMWSYQIWRACRLVVDTGMHAFGWSRERAIEFMADNTGMTVEAVTAEIDRHITEPGQGLAYTMGNLEITRLRNEAEARLGASFDVRDFHHAVLANGPLPLSLLRREVRSWIEAVASEESP